MFNTSLRFISLRIPLKNSIKRKWRTMTRFVLCLIVLSLLATLVFVFLRDHENLAFESLEFRNAPRLSETQEAARREYLSAYLNNLPKWIVGKLLKASLQSSSKSEGISPIINSHKIIIVSTWRSGSSFLDQALASHAAAFNHYEPLHHLGIKRISHLSTPEGVDAVNFIRGVLNCRYTNTSYFTNIRKSKFLIRNNERIWEICKHNSDLCFQRNFLEASCLLFPINVIKTVRLGFSMVSSILQEESPNTHAVLLVRDPRAIMVSRTNEGVVFCKTSVCSDSSVLCQNMDDDYEALQALSQQFEGRVHLVRYEDIALSPLKALQNLSAELKIDFDSSMRDFVGEHSFSTSNDPFSVYKESSKRATSWIENIDIKTALQIETNCSKIMDKLGYLNLKAPNIVNSTMLLDPLKLDTSSELV